MADYADLLKKEVGTLDGFVAAALADSESGMALATIGGSKALDIDIAAAANTEVVRAKRKAIKALGLNDEIDDILITLSSQYHVIRPIPSSPGVFMYVALDRNGSNLALARMKIKTAAAAVKL